MSIPLFVRPEAVADLQEAFEWYEKRAPGLGAQLVGELDHALAVEDDRIVVLAILHAARHPRVARRRDGGARGASGQ
jgi:plasmid stabilization system protein ParE